MGGTERGRDEAARVVHDADELVVRCRTADDGTVEVLLEGELDLASAAPLDGVLDDVRGGAAALVVDLSGLTFIDSTGIRLLLDQAEAARRGGWSLVLRRPSPVVARTLELAGVTSLLPLAG